MLRVNPAFDERLLGELLSRRFGVESHPLEFRPLGEDSWCYEVGSLWVSVRRDLRGHVPAAYEAAHELRESGLEFVLAPMPDREGRIVHDVAGWPVVVFPKLAVEPLERLTTRAVREGVVEILERVHRAAPSAALPSETFALSFDDDLDWTLRRGRDPAGPPAGPYSERVCRLIREHTPRIEALRAEHRRAAKRCAAESGPMVLTHGEPISSNILIDDAGRLLLGDWGEAAWAPPERDWSHVIRTLGVDVPHRPQFKLLYDLRWTLSEIAEYATVLLGPHDGGADDAAMWHRLLRYIPGRASRP